MPWRFDSAHRFPVIVASALAALIGCGETPVGLFSSSSSLPGGVGLTGGASSSGSTGGAVVIPASASGGSGEVLSTGGMESGGARPTSGMQVGAGGGASGGAHSGGAHSGGANSGGAGGTINASSGGIGQSGSPGTGGSRPKLVINEIFGIGDLVEIYNAEDRVVDISGYLVTDDTSTSTPDVDKPFVFPANTRLQPGAFAVVIGIGEEDGAVNGGPFTGEKCGNLTVKCYQGIFAVSQSDGDNLFLLNPSGVVLDHVTYPADTSPSYGRLPNGTGSFAVTSEVTFGFPNK